MRNLSNHFIKCKSSNQILMWNSTHHYASYERWRVYYSIPWLCLQMKVKCSWMDTAQSTDKKPEQIPKMFQLQSFWDLTFLRLWSDCLTLHLYSYSVVWSPDAQYPYIASCIRAASYDHSVWYWHVGSERGSNRVSFTLGTHTQYCTTTWYYVTDLQLSFFCPTNIDRLDVARTYF